MSNAVQSPNSWNSALLSTVLLSVTAASENLCTLTIERKMVMVALEVALLVGLTYSHFECASTNTKYIFLLTGPA